MTSARLLLWLVSMVALLVPPVATSHAMAPSRPGASIDCPDHTPAPPPLCPDHGTAKHAAGDCCSLMAPMMALLPAAAAVETQITFRMPMAQRTPGYAGRIVTKDPPPPRV